MTDHWTIEVESEVRDWLNGLPASHYRMGVTPDLSLLHSLARALDAKIDPSIVWP